MARARRRIPISMAKTRYGRAPKGTRPQMQLDPGAFQRLNFDLLRKKAAYMGTMGGVRKEISPNLFAPQMKSLQDAYGAMGGGAPLGNSDPAAAGFEAANAQLKADLAARLADTPAGNGDQSIINPYVPPSHIPEATPPRVITDPITGQPVDLPAPIYDTPVPYGGGVPPTPLPYSGPDAVTNPQVPPGTANPVYTPATPATSATPATPAAGATPTPGDGTTPPLAPGTPAPATAATPATPASNASPATNPWQLPPLPANPLGAQTDAQYEIDAAKLRDETNKARLDAMRALGWDDPATGRHIPGTMEIEAQRHQEELMRQRGLAGEEVGNQSVKAGNWFSSRRVQNLATAYNPIDVARQQQVTDLADQLGMKKQDLANLISDYGAENAGLLAGAAERAAARIRENPVGDATDEAAAGGGAGDEAGGTAAPAAGGGFKWGGQTWGPGDKTKFTAWLGKHGVPWTRWANAHPQAAATFTAQPKKEGPKPSGGSKGKPKGGKPPRTVEGPKNPPGGGGSKSSGGTKPSGGSPPRNVEGPKKSPPPPKTKRRGEPSASFIRATKPKPKPKPKGEPKSSTAYVHRKRPGTRKHQIRKNY